MAGTRKCAHPACSCIAPDRQKYFSQMPGLKEFDPFTGSTNKQATIPNESAKSRGEARRGKGAHPSCRQQQKTNQRFCTKRHQICDQTQAQSRR